MGGGKRKAVERAGGGLEEEYKSVEGDRIDKV